MFCRRHSVTVVVVHVVLEATMAKMTPAEQNWSFCLVFLSIKKIFLRTHNVFIVFLIVVNLLG